MREPREGHLCCGSAGTYNILQPEIAAQLRDRKVKNIEATGADIVATGNIGCITQIAGGAGMPIVHTVELLDWAYGGPKPNGFERAAEAIDAGPKQKGQRCHCGALPSLAAVRSDPLRCSGRPPRIYMTMTLVPTLTRSYRSTTSSLRRRMQPDETLVPIVHGALVPWMR